MATLDDRYFRDNPEHISNPRLVAALVAVVTRDTPETRKELYKALSLATLILPASERAPENRLSGATDVEVKAGALQVKMYEDQSGGNILVVFTDEDAVLAWMPAGTPFVALKGGDLFDLADYNEVMEIILNPGGPVSGIVRRSEIASLAKGEMPAHPTSQPSPPQTSVLIGNPAQLPPQSVLDDLRQAMQRQPGITAAYVFQIQVQPAEPRLMVGVIFESTMGSAEQDQAMESFLADFDAVSPQEEEGMEFLVLDSEDFLRIVRDTVPPLYER